MPEENVKIVASGGLLDFLSKGGYDEKNCIILFSKLVHEIRDVEKASVAFCEKLNMLHSTDIGELVEKQPSFIPFGSQELSLTQSSDKIK